MAFLSHFCRALLSANGNCNFYDYIYDVDDYEDTDDIDDIDDEDEICVSDSQQPLAQSPLAPRSCRQPPFISVPSSWIMLQLVII